MKALSFASSIVLASALFVSAGSQAQESPYYFWEVREPQEVVPSHFSWLWEAREPQEVPSHFWGLDANEVADREEAEGLFSSPVTDEPTSQIDYNALEIAAERNQWTPSYDRARIYQGYPYFLRSRVPISPEQQNMADDRLLNTDKERVEPMGGCSGEDAPNPECPFFQFPRLEGTAGDCSSGVAPQKPTIEILPAQEPDFDKVDEYTKPYAPVC